jgi:hypothetical protein
MMKNANMGLFHACGAKLYLDFIEALPGVQSIAFDPGPPSKYLSQPYNAAYKNAAFTRKRDAPACRQAAHLNI